MDTCTYVLGVVVLVSQSRQTMVWHWRGRTDEYWFILTDFRLAFFSVASWTIAPLCANWSESLCNLAFAELWVVAD